MSSFVYGSHIVAVSHTGQDLIQADDTFSRVDFLPGGQIVRGMMGANMHMCMRHVVINLSL